jgi:O-succinylbenzoic acid--CoA ligase
MDRHDSLTINGRPFSKAGLLAEASLHLNRPATPPWLQDFWTFIREWLSDLPYVIVTTSGSTGVPKPIRIRKEQMVNSALATGKYFRLSPNERALLCLPCRYIAGRMMVVRAFVLEMDLISVPPSGNPLARVEGDIHFGAMVPMQVARALGESPGKLRRVKTLIIGGAPVGRELYLQLQGIPIACHATYGMTETVTHIAVKRLNGMAKQSFYFPLPDVRFDTDERGCLVIHAPKVADAPVVTNDVVRLFLPSGKFTWLGRHDNVINSGGVKVHPEEVEEILAPYLHDRFFIIGRPHPEVGEEVTLVVERSHWPEGDKERWLQEVKPLLGRFEVPRRILCAPHFVETDTGKIKREATLAKAR